MSDSSEKRPELLDALSVGPVGVTSPLEVERAREKMLPWLEEQVAGVPQQRLSERARENFRRRAVWAMGGLAVAAAVTLAFFLEAPPAPEVGAQAREGKPIETRETATLVTGKLRSASHTWMGGQELALSGRLEAGDEGAALQVDRGYQMELRPASAVSFERLGPGTEQRNGVYLHQGVLKISVLPLPQGSELMVKTGDVLLTVVKSAFTVEAREGEPSCVRVTEGEVSVHSGGERRIISAGTSFGCSGEAPALVEAARAIVRKNPAASRTTLPQENTLLARALAAESRGQLSEAKAAFQELLAKYPRSAFAQDARAGLQRLSR